MNVCLLAAMNRGLREAAVAWTDLLDQRKNGRAANAALQGRK